MASSAGNTSQEALVTFEKNEVVLCYHGPLIYEAKVNESRNFDEKNSLTGYTGVHYHVHYKGWKTTWDEWVSYNRLLKLTPENLEKQREVLAKHTGPQSSSAGPRTHKAGGGGQSGHGSASTRTGRKEAQGRGTKRGRDDDDVKKPEMKLAVSEELKSILIDDWENVTKSGKIVKLRKPEGQRPKDEPVVPTVSDILAEFIKYVETTRPPSLRNPDTLAPTIKAGLITYFDKALGHSLLYRPERAQYAEVQKQYRTGHHVDIANLVEVSDIYGAPHLLRMLVQLPSIIATTTLDVESVAIVRDYTNELLAWLSKNSHHYFGEQVYDQTSTHYQMLAKT